MFHLIKKIAVISHDSITSRYWFLPRCCKLENTKSFSLALFLLLASSLENKGGFCAPALLALLAEHYQAERKTLFSPPSLLNLVLHTVRNNLMSLSTAVQLTEGIKIRHMKQGYLAVTYNSRHIPKWSRNAGYRLCNVSYNLKATHFNLCIGRHVSLNLNT